MVRIISGAIGGEMGEEEVDLIEEWAVSTISHLINTMVKALLDPPPDVPDVLNARLVYHKYRVRIRVDIHAVSDERGVGSIKKRVRWGIYNFVCRWLKM